MFILVYNGNIASTKEDKIREIISREIEISQKKSRIKYLYGIYY